MITKSSIWTLIGYGTAIVSIIVILTIAYLYPDADNNKIETNYFLSKCKDCKSSEELASQDFKKNEAKWFATGLREEQVAGEFPETFYEELETKFKLKIVFTGCIRYKQFDCYNKRIYNLISETYGKDKLQQIYLETKNALTH